MVYSLTVPNTSPAIANLRRGVTLALLGYWCLIFTLTHVRFDADPLPGGSDKLVHLLMYFGLGFLLAWRLNMAGIRGLRLVASVTAIAATYGALDELSQTLVGRHADVNDWLADCAGSLLGACALLILQDIARRWFAERTE